MGHKAAKCDLVIARIAARQHGVVSVAQLRAAGMSREVAAKRAKAGRLHRLHRGVYAVGHTRLGFEGRCMAAVLALGDGAAVSHASAASLWGMLKPTGGPIEITVSGNGGRERRRGIEVHRSSTLIADFRTLRQGIAVTKPRRTLRDLHRTAPEPLFRGAVRRALDLRLIASSDLKSDDALTRSELERIFRRLCHRHRLPQPEVNSRVGPYEVDFLWREQGLVVETDSWRHHADRLAFERDRARDVALHCLGFRVLRFTYRQVTRPSPEIAAFLRAMLGREPLTPDL